VPEEAPIVFDCAACPENGSVAALVLHGGQWDGGTVSDEQRSGAMWSMSEEPGLMEPLDRGLIVWLRSLIRSVVPGEAI